MQAVDVAGPGPFWALQYHPEYDLHEVASLCRLRAQELVDQGRFPDLRAAEAYSEDLEALHRDPGDGGLLRRLELAPTLLDEAARTVEVRNWVASLPGAG